MWRGTIPPAVDRDLNGASENFQLVTTLRDGWQSSTSASSTTSSIHIWVTKWKGNDPRYYLFLRINSEAGSLCFYTLRLRHLHFYTHLVLTVRNISKYNGEFVIRILNLHFFTNRITQRSVKLNWKEMDHDIIMYFMSLVLLLM